jgi:hypothetical protein
VSGIEDAILVQPTHTPEGLRVQAQIAARYMQALADWGGRTYDVFSRFVEGILRQTVADHSTISTSHGHRSPNRIRG